MNSRIALVLVGLVLGVGCSSTGKFASEPTRPRVRWHAHCDVCKTCKGSFKTTEEAQQVVSSHNKQMHDWYRVAYYHEGKCPAVAVRGQN